MAADFSPCGRYRYKLSRVWADGDKLAFVMLNPSTADSELDDPTIRRCIRFSRDAGFGGLMVGNLFAWRATDPAQLRRVEAPIGPDNDSSLAEIMTASPVIICAWGGNAFGGRDVEVLAMIRAAGKVPHCLKMTAGGQPAHPLYLSASLRPIPMN
jgi:hypothetical protein